MQMLRAGCGMSKLPRGEGLPCFLQGVKYVCAEEGTTVGACICYGSSSSGIKKWISASSNRIACVNKGFSAEHGICTLQVQSPDLKLSKKMPSRYSHEVWLNNTLADFVNRYKMRLQASHSRQ